MSHHVMVVTDVNRFKKHDEIQFSVVTVYPPAGYPYIHPGAMDGLDVILESVLLSSLCIRNAQMIPMIEPIITSSG